jgi:hypothetical protein
MDFFYDHFDHDNKNMIKDYALIIRYIDEL